jgi:hypothetical protein
MRRMQYSQGEFSRLRPIFYHDVFKNLLWDIFLPLVAAYSVRLISYPLGCPILFV